MSADRKGVQLPPVEVFPIGHGQWAFAAGSRSGTGYASKQDAHEAGELAAQKVRAQVGLASCEVAK